MHRMIRLTAAPALAAAALYSGSAVADHGGFGFGLGTASPINTETAITLPEGKFSVGTRTVYQSFSQFSNSQLNKIARSINSGEDRDIHSLDSVLSVSLMAAYGVTDNFSVGLRFPYVWRSNVQQVGGHAHGAEEADHHDEEAQEPIQTSDVRGLLQALGSPNGIGDMTMFGQYRLFHTDDNKTNLSALVGLKFPTGLTGRTTRPTATRPVEQYETHFQPGTGSWDPSLSVAFTQLFGNFSLDSNIWYLFATDGAQGVNMGDSMNYNVALSWSPGKTLGGLAAASNVNALTLIVELNGEWFDYQHNKGARDPDTGGHMIYISPGLRYGAGQNWNVAVSVMAPVLTSMNGIQVDPGPRVINRINILF